MTRSKEFTLSLPGNVPVTCRLIHLDRQSFVYLSATGDLSFNSLAIAIPNTLQQGDVSLLCCVCSKILKCVLLLRHLCNVHINYY